MRKPKPPPRPMKRCPVCGGTRVIEHGGVKKGCNRCGGTGEVPA